jgi:hypothetical protein
LHLAVDRFECLPDLPVLCAHHRGRTSLHSHARFPRWRQNILFPHDMPLQSELEFHKTGFRVRRINAFELMELFQYIVKPIMIHLKNSLMLFDSVVLSNL